MIKKRDFWILATLICILVLVLVFFGYQGSRSEPGYFLTGACPDEIMERDNISVVMYEGIRYYAEKDVMAWIDENCDLE